MSYNHLHYSRRGLAVAEERFKLPLIDVASAQTAQSRAVPGSV